MVLLDTVGGRVDEDRLQATLAREVGDALLEAVDSGNSKKTADDETGLWFYSMPSPGVRYYAFYRPPKHKATGSQALPKVAPRHGAGGSLPR